MSVINTNYLALVSQNNLTKSQNALGTAIERLSSGLRINSAKDDAAGQAIANRFTANIKGLTQAARNANDGISIAQTTEGALNEINNNLQRVRELTVQAQNSTNSASDIDSIQQEVNERFAEINRIAKQTNFNGIKVLEGGNDKEFAIQVGAQDNEIIEIKIKGNTTWNLYDDTVTTPPTGLVNNETRKVAAQGFDVLAAASETLATEAASHAAGLTEAITKSGFGTGATASLVSYNGGESYAIVVDEDGSGGAGFKSYAVSFAAVDHDNDPLTPEQAKMVVGEELTGAAKEAAEADTATPIAAGGNVTIASGTSTALAKIDAALKAVDNQRSDLGAIQNRFQSTIANLSNTITNLSAARSRIEDADYAVEVSNMTRAQILQQAGTSVLAQANQVPQGVLSLLR